MMDIQIFAQILNSCLVVQLSETDITKEKSESLERTPNSYDPIPDVKLGSNLSRAATEQEIKTETSGQQWRLQITVETKVLQIK